jgi:predicted enzyme related to lactoylglutathione lyase
MQGIIMSNAINWFELPSTNLQRAMAFYSQVLGAEFQKIDMGDVELAFFPTKDQGVGGCLTYGNGNSPNAEGALVYLNGGDDLSDPLARVEAAGGKVVVPRTSIGENGYYAIFMDTEGNWVAFNSMQ